MKVNVRLHAILRDLLPPGGRGEVELPDGAQMKDLLDLLEVDADLRELITVNKHQISDLDGHLLADGDEVEVFPAVMGGSANPYLVEGLKLFDEADYFMSHETLEEYWAEAPEEERDFFQGLINLAVGLHHYHRGNLNGMRLQFRKAETRLKRYPSNHQGVDVAAVRGFLAQAHQTVADGRSLRPPTLSPQALS